MEVRTHSKTGPVVTSLSETITSISDLIRARQEEWLCQLRQDPARFAQLEMEVHETFQHLADEVVAGLLCQGSEQSPVLEGAAKK